MSRLSAYTSKVTAVLSSATAQQARVGGRGEQVDVQLSTEAVTLECEVSQPLRVLNSAGGGLYRGWHGGDRGFLEPDLGQYDTPCEVFSWCGGAVVLSAEYLRDAGIFDPTYFLYYEDFDLAWRGRQLGWTYRYEPSVSVLHEHAYSSKAGSVFFNFWVNRNRRLTLVKNAPRAVAFNAIVGFSRLLQDTSLDLKQRDYVDKTSRAAEVLMRTVNDVLDFSKIESGKLTLETQPFNLRECVEDALDLLAANAAQKGLDLVSHMDDDVPETVVGDVTRVRQILVNLVGNAIKFTDNGEVSVAVEPGSPEEAGPAGTLVHFAVSDTGIGIAAADLPHVFERFFRVDRARSRAEGGAGIGLSIVKAIATAHGGTVSVESRERQVTSFNIRLPHQPSPLNAKLDNARRTN